MGGLGRWPGAQGRGWSAEPSFPGCSYAREKGLRWPQWLGSQGILLPAGHACLEEPLPHIRLTAVTPEKK